MRFYVFAAAFLLLSCAQTRIHERPELELVFREHGIGQACFIMRDHTHESVIFYNQERCMQRFSPASTFKIFNALVALETAKAPDEQLIIPWDSVIRQQPDWNKNMNMREAFRVSNVPYFQELARRIGSDNMQHFLDTVQYGNKRMGGAMDQFWLNDTLLISADEQTGLMKKLYFDQLPFSDRSQRIVRSMMLQESYPDYKLYYKTGTAVSSDSTTYWVVGYMEQTTQYKEHKNSMNKSDVRNYPYFFAQHFTVPGNDFARWTAIRITILHQILEQLIPEKGN